MKKITLLVILAIIIRLVLAVTTYHSDLGAFAQAGRVIAGEGKWLTFYDTMLVPKVDTVFNYQPLAYLIPSVFYLPFRGLILETGNLIKNHDWIVSNPSLFNPLLLLYKYPMILADLAFLWLIPKFFSGKKEKNLAIILWAFNPLAIFVSSMMGQVDIIIALLLTVGLYLYQKERPLLSVVLISLSALIKPAGLILIPILALHYFVTKRKLVPSLLLAGSGLAVYILGILPYLGSAAYRHYALFAEQIGKSTYAAISIASGHDIPLFFIFYALILILVWKKRLTFPTAVAASLLSTLAFSHFHPQWLVWIMPWFIIYSIIKSDYFLYIATIICWLLILFSFDPSLHLQMFIHSTIALPTSLSASSYFTEIVQLARAGIIAILVWLLVDYEKN
jgi:hypothetical protein